MRNLVTNTVAYLRTSRSFPQEIDDLTVELSRSYIDIAQAVNSRVIGVFSVNTPSINGKEWYFTAQKRQGLQQIYEFTSAGSIPHNINTSSIYKFSQGYGTYTDGTNIYGVIFGTNVAIAGQVSFYITSTNIVIQADAGAPAIQSGFVVLEWIANT